MFPIFSFFFFFFLRNTISKNVNKDVLNMRGRIFIYSNSVVERSTTRCLRELRATKFEPRKIHRPLIDFLSSNSRLLAQSTLETRLRVNGEVGLKVRPIEVVP